MTVWRKIPGFDDCYEVSQSGDVRSSRSGSWKTLSANQCTPGYLQVTLMAGKKRKIALVHRLVALAFVPNPEHKKEVNHKDGNKLNNHASNLEWCTRSENLKHAYAKGFSVDAQRRASRASAIKKKYLSRISRISKQSTKLLAEKNL